MDYTHSTVGAPPNYKTNELPIPVTAIRYYLPVEMLSTDARVNLYHYCCCLYPGYRVWPVGYCAEGCPGHHTRAEAREHYRQFLLERFAQYGGRLNSPAACAVCGRNTSLFASVEYHFDCEVVPLCSLHLNREGLLSTFVFKDYHLLQISDARSPAVMTVTGSGGTISIVRPRSSCSFC